MRGNLALKTLNLQISADREKVDKIVLKKGRSGGSVISENRQKILAKGSNPKNLELWKTWYFKKIVGNFTNY